MSSLSDPRAEGRDALADVTALLRENTELRNRLAAMERVVSVVEASGTAILSTATDGTILSWNRAAERLFGFTTGQAVGRSALELVPFDRLAEHQTAVERALAGDHVTLDTRRRRRDGTLIDAIVMYVRLTDPNGRPIGISTMAYTR